jgi:phosphoglycerol transferase
MLTFIVFVASFLLFLSRWVVESYGNDVAFGQFLFHIQVGLAGNEGADVAVVQSFLKMVVGYTLATTIAYLALKIFIRRKSSSQAYKALKVLTFVFVVFSLSVTTINFNLKDYVQTRFGEDLFTALYQPPKNVDLVTPTQPRNLILLYVESLENNFKDIEGQNLIEPIEALPGFHVPGFRQAPGTNWSIAGMVASQCAIPLKGFDPSDWNVFKQDQFLPSALCLGDILNKFGYEQIFLTGPEVEFAGVSKFYNTHHFDQLIGRDEVKKIIKDKDLFTSWGWGLHDDSLLDLAYDIAVQTAKSPKPFNLTIITTDNHTPHGLPSPRCKPQERVTSFVGAVKCSSRSVGQFVERVLKNRALANTDIVVMGDHLYMAIPEQEKKFSKDRTVYFKYINSRKEGLARTEMTHFDVAPTILDSLGLMKDNTQKFGLGYSVFAPVDNYLELQAKNLSLEIISPSETYDALWQSSPEQDKTNINK